MSFKVELIRNIHRSRANERPWDMYEFDDDTWHKFVKIKHSVEFQLKRKKAQKIQEKNVYSYRLTRGGYELLEERIIAEKLKQRLEASRPDGASTFTDPSSPLARTEKRKVARMKRSGEYTSDATRQMVKNMDSLTEQNIQGIFVPQGRQDILTIALGTPEHPGRGVGIDHYFGRPSSLGAKVATLDDIAALRVEITEQIRAELRQNLYGVQVEPIVVPSPSIVLSSKESCIGPTDAGSEEEQVDTSGISAQCEFYIAGILTS